MSSFDSHSLLLFTVHNAEEGAWAKHSAQHPVSLCLERLKLGPGSLPEMHKYSSTLYLFMQRRPPPASCRKLHGG